MAENPSGPSGPPKGPAPKGPKPCNPRSILFLRPRLWGNPSSSVLFWSAPPSVSSPPNASNPSTTSSPSTWNILLDVRIYLRLKLYTYICPYLSPPPCLIFAFIIDIAIIDHRLIVIMSYSIFNYYLLFWFRCVKLDLFISLQTFSSYVWPASSSLMSSAAFVAVMFTCFLVSRWNQGHHEKILQEHRPETPTTKDNNSKEGN